MTHVMIRFSTTAPPAGASDGSLLADLISTAGAAGSFVHTGLDHNRTYYYAVFAHNGTPIYASGVTASARPALPGDLDGDGDVDQTDFGLFQACLVDSGQPYPTDCASADLQGESNGDGDGDVDQGDLTVFMTCLGGPSQPPGC
jgi:hypothetical protein